MKRGSATTEKLLNATNKAGAIPKWMHQAIPFLLEEWELRGYDRDAWANDRYKIEDKENAR